MPPKTAATPKPHIGRKIERLRTIKGLKQETLAKQLGITQSALSKIERSEDVAADKLQQIADALEVTADAIENFNEDAVVNFIQNNSDISGGYYGYNQTVNHPLDKYIELVEENKKLYEQLLAEKASKIALLEQMLKK